MSGEIRLREYIRLLLESAVDDFHSALAHFWTRGGNPGADYNALIKFVAELKGMSEDEADEWWFANAENLYEDWHQAIDDLQSHKLLPSKPKDTVRVHHNFGLNANGDGRVAILKSVLQNGVRPQPKTSGKHSELPGAVFAVVDIPGSTDSRYNKHFPWITADIPFDKLHRWDRDVQPGNVLTLAQIDREDIVGVNGLPVERYSSVESGA